MLLRLLASRPLRAALLSALAALALWLRAPRLPHSDFCSYYTAGRLVAEGSPETAFDFAALRARHRELHGPGFGVGPFLYSPLYLVPSALFGQLPFEAAMERNRILGVLALAGGLAFVLLRLPSWRWEIAVSAAFAIAHPSWVQLGYQNWSFLLFFLLSAAWYFGERARAGPAALFWALAIHLKAFVGLGALALLIVGRRRIVLAATILSVLLAALALPWTGVESYRRFGAFLRGRGDAGVTPFYNKVSLQATLARFESEPREWIAARSPVATLPIRALFWVALPLLALGVYHLRRSPDAALAFTYAGMLLVVPQIWDHTEIVLFLLLPAIRARERGLLVALLAASVGYNGLVQPLLAEVVRGDTPAFVLQSLLLFFPAANLLALGGALAGGEPARDEAVSA